jgi:hypothetical protein
MLIQFQFAYCVEGLLLKYVPFIFVIANFFIYVSFLPCLGEL